MKLTINKLAYHRNGVAGNGFHVALFTWRDGRTMRKMIATVFDNTGALAVLELKNPDCRWRGDDFEPELRAAIAKLYPEVQA